MGPLREKVLDDEEYEVVVTQFWLQVFRYLKSLPVDLSCLKVYQDGLADTDAGVVERAIEETQTANYEILRWLKEKGALIIGTEDHQSLQAIFNFPDEAAKDAARLEYLEKSSWLLENKSGKRLDRFFKEC